MAANALDRDLDGRPHGGHGRTRQVRVGRQGIHTRDRDLTGYQLLFRTTAAGEADLGTSEAEQATAALIASTFASFGLSVLADGRTLFANLTRAFLTGVLPIPVEADDVVLEVNSSLVADHELVLGVRDLRDAGYRIALTSFRADPSFAELLELADYIAIDVESLPRAELFGVMGTARETGATLIAAGVSSEDSFIRCQELGFELFRGNYLERASVLEQNVLSPSQLVCIRLLNELADPDVSIGQIEQLVASDPGLTVRMLRTASSASAAGVREVESLRQALILIGPRQLRTWAMLTLLEGVTIAGSSRQALWHVLARAHACRQLAGPEADLALTVGLLHGAADLLGAPIADVVAGAGVGSQVKAALLAGEGLAGRALFAVLAHEREDDIAVNATGLQPLDVSQAYLDSLATSLELVQEFLGR